MDSRSNIRDASKSITTSTAKRANATMQISTVLSMNNPEIWPKNPPKTGMIITMDICSAARGSFTCEDTIKEKVVAKTASNGPTTRMAISQCGSKKVPSSNLFLMRMEAPMANIAKAPYVAMIAGMTAARHLPTNNSIVVMGVANKGSRLRVVFSPTIE